MNVVVTPCVSVGWLMLLISPFFFSSTGDEHIDLTSTNLEDCLSSGTSSDGSHSAPKITMNDHHSHSHASDKTTLHKPKIWSLAHTATSSSPPVGRRSPMNLSNISGAVASPPRVGVTTPLSCATSMWNPAALYAGGYTYSAPFPGGRYAALGAVNMAAKQQAEAAEAGKAGLVGEQTSSFPAGMSHHHRLSGG